MQVYHTQPDHAGLQTKLDNAGLQPVPAYGHPQYMPQEATYAQQQPYQHYQVNESPKSERRICGLRRTTFWLVLLIILILILAVVGGTVGGVIGSQKSNTSVVTTTSIAGSSSTPSTTASQSGLQSASITNIPSSQQTTPAHTGSASQPSSSSSALRAGCPGSSGSKWTSESGYNTFQIYCATDFPVNDMINGEYVPLSNFDACLEFCASLNDKRNFTLCYGVSFAYEYEPSGGCYLKNPAIDVAADMKSDIVVDSGILVL